MDKKIKTEIGGAYMSFKDIFALVRFLKQIDPEFYYGKNFSDYR